MKTYKSPAVFGGSDDVFAIPALLATGAAAVVAGLAAKAIRGDRNLSAVPSLEPCMIA